MSSDTWTPFYWGDFLRDTSDLSCQQVGIYVRLLARYYTQGGPFDDTNVLRSYPDGVYRICAAMTKKEKKEVIFVLDKYFPLLGSVRRNKRADKEIEKSRIRSEKARESIRKRWEKNDTNVLQTYRKRIENVSEKAYEIDTNVILSTTTTKEEELLLSSNSSTEIFNEFDVRKGDGAFSEKTPSPKKNEIEKKVVLSPDVDEKAWSDFDTHRNSTAALRKNWTALAKQKAQALLAQHTPTQQRDMVDNSIRAGWTGLFPRTGGTHETRQHVDNSAPARVQRANERRERERQEREKLIDAERID